VSGVGQQDVVYSPSHKLVSLCIVYCWQHYRGDLSHLSSAVEDPICDSTLSV